jgi:hypothetical protein
LLSARSHAGSCFLNGLSPRCPLSRPIRKTKGFAPFIPGDIPMGEVHPSSAPPKAKQRRGFRPLRRRLLFLLSFAFIQQAVCGNQGGNGTHPPRSDALWARQERGAVGKRYKGSFSSGERIPTYRRAQIDVRADQQKVSADELPGLHSQGQSSHRAEWRVGCKFQTLLFNGFFMPELKSGIVPPWRD